MGRQFSHFLGNGLEEGLGQSLEEVVRDQVGRRGTEGGAWRVGVLATLHGGAKSFRLYHANASFCSATPERETCSTLLERWRKERFMGVQ